MRRSGSLYEASKIGGTGETGWNPHCLRLAVLTYPELDVAQDFSSGSEGLGNLIQEFQHCLVPSHWPYSLGIDHSRQVNVRVV